MNLNTYSNLTDQVTTTVRERVQLVNKGLHWEMDQAVIKIKIPSDTDYLDMKYE